MNMGVLVVDLNNHNILYINPFLNKLLKLNTPGKLNMSHLLWNFTLNSDVHFIESVLSDLIKEKSAQGVEFNISVEEKLVYISCDACFLDDENKVVLFVRDITKNKEHENYISTYGAKKDSLLEMLGHHLSGSLSLSGQVIRHLQHRDKAESLQSVEEHIKFIEESNQHCIQFINDLLKEEHLVSERIFVKKNRFDVMERINAVLSQFNHSYPGHEIILKEAPEHLFINGDDVKFFQIMNNLIINAIKFTPEDKSISVTVRNEDDHVFVSVVDEGIGIPDHLKSLIFQKYTPAGRTGLNGEKSVGIGLSIVKRLVELMGGKIEFRSGENKGSAFSFTLPKE